jgi:hypothetical protein
LAADRRHRGLGDCGLITQRLASAASTSRTDRLRTNDAITSVSSAFVLVTCDPNSRDANASLMPRSFGLASCTGPAVVFTVTSRYPFRDPGRASSQAAAR